jgi:hypothetical protein
MQKKVMIRKAVLSLSVGPFAPSYFLMILGNLLSGSSNSMTGRWVAVEPLAPIEVEESKVSACGMEKEQQEWNRYRLCPIIRSSFNFSSPPK